MLGGDFADFSEFVERSRTYLCAEYLPKIRVCVGRLSAEDLWWQPNPASNSVGHLLLHLSGNLHEWIVSGLSGKQAHRCRAQEFAPETKLPSGPLLEHLMEAVAEADAVLAQLASVGRSKSQLTIQGRQVSEMAAVYHAVEHFSMHTGQIIYITKLRTGAELDFYVSDSGVMRATWEGRVRDV